MTIHKSDLLQVYKTQAAVARALGITRSAVSQWGDVIPELQRFRLRELQPEVYAKVAKESHA
jgi:predicted transcriptional regulator